MSERILSHAFALVAASAGFMHGIAPATATPAAKKITFELRKVGPESFQPGPFASLSVAEIKPKDGYPTTKLECDTMSDSDGKLNCVLTACDKNDSLKRSFILVMTRRSGFNGPWDQTVVTRGCIIQADTPVDVPFTFTAYAEVQSVLADIASLDLPVTIDELNRGTIESETFSRALQASRIADPVEVDNRWVIGTDMFKFVKRAQDLSALYLVIAEASTSEAERKKAENAAAQWSAYIKAAVNVSTINVATANFTSSAGSDFLYTAKLGDLRSNARQLAILGAQSDAAIPKALSQRLDAFEQSLAGGRLTTNELRLWSDVVGVPGGV